ncbi:(Fe-S)-binding protein [bacterium]|nr:(Fe-S)-binding protein [bacterium]
METKNLEVWEEEMDICIRCGYCFEGCPIYKEKRWESDGARGKVILAHGLLRGDLKPTDYLVQKIFECSFCRDCIERCSANVSIPDILSAARADIVSNGYKNEEHINLLKKIDETGNIFGEKLEAPYKEGEIPVLLGCRLLERKEDSKRYIKMLENLGIKPQIYDETCCGMPYAVLGYKDDFAKQQEKFRERAPQNKMICLCTTCVFFIKKKYPDLEAIYVIDEVYKRIFDIPHKKLGMTVTYHDPCNVARGMNMVKEPREILKEIGVELVELPTNGKKAECCGGGGGLLVTNNPLAEKLALNRVEQALKVGVDTLVTLCPTCEFNIKNAAEKNNKNLKVLNVLDLIAEAVS